MVSFLLAKGKNRPLTFSGRWGAGSEVLETSLLSGLYRGRRPYPSLPYTTQLWSQLPISDSLGRLGRNGRLSCCLSLYNVLMFVLIPCPAVCLHILSCFIPRSVGEVGGGGGGVVVDYPDIKFLLSDIPDMAGTREIISPCCQSPATVY